MAALEVIALDTSVPQLMAPQAGDTYTFPRAVEMPLNTANGVLYLNASKVVTSGSALTFDGTNLGVNTTPLGGGRISTIGDFSAVNGVVIQDSATTYANNDWYLLLRNSSSNAIAGLSHPAANSLGIWGNDDIRFLITGAQTEQMRLDSTGLGIGTTPGVKLDIAAATAIARLTSTTGTNVGYYQVSNTGGGLYIGRDSFAGGGFYSGSPAYGAIFLSTGAYPMAFAVDSVERMRLDASGNLGLGVTPSAWDTIKPIEIARAGSFVGANSSGSTYLGANTRFSGGSWRYANNGAAGLYTVEDNIHFWRTAPSGTAGNPIFFSQVMTLDASGQLLLGTTTANGVLTVVGGSQITHQYTGSSGAFAIGQFNSSGDASINNTVNGPLLFATNNTERARITSGGSLVVGTAALATTATDGFLYVPTCAGTPTGTPTTQTGTAPIVVDTTNNKLYFYSGGQWRDAGP